MFPAFVITHRHAVALMIRTRRLATICGALSVLAVCSAFAYRPRADVARSDQVLRGKVIDYESRKPISDAIVSLITESGKAFTKPVRSDSTGAFVIHTARLGRMRLHATRIGYRPVTTPSFGVGETDILTFELEMSATAQLLAPLTIIAKAKPKNLRLVSFSGFEYRMRRAAGGRFFTQADIEERGALSVGDMVKGLAGTFVTGVGIEQSISFRIALAGAINGIGCGPMYYIDGQPFPADRTVTQRGDTVFTVPIIISGLMMTDVVGMEVYSNASVVPGEFSLATSGCGVIAVWTHKT